MTNTAAHEPWRTRIDEALTSTTHWQAIIALQDDEAQEALDAIQEVGRNVIPCARVVENPILTLQRAASGHTSA
jgi:hypothetical protein